MSTPVKATPIQAAPAVDSPGTWRHPRLNEITRRRDATTFSEKNVRKIAYNLLALFAIWTIQLVFRIYVDPKLFPASFRLYLGWASSAFQILPCIQVVFACLPLVRARDDLSDIPLTPAQRKLLGLPPSSAANPNATYSTPPRYSRTPSMAGSVGSRGSYSNSPLSGRGSPALGGTSRGGSGSPFSPIDSPSQHKPMPSFGLSSNRRSSLTSGSPFGLSSSNNLFVDPGSPSPAGPKRTSVGLNSKWLYEKGRRSSGSAWMH